MDADIRSRLGGNGGFAGCVPPMRDLSRCQHVAAGLNAVINALLSADHLQQPPTAVAISGRRQAEQLVWSSRVLLGRPGSILQWGSGRVSQPLSMQLQCSDQTLIGCALPPEQSHSATTLHAHDRYGELSEPDIAESEQLLLRAFGSQLEAAKSSSRHLVALGRLLAPSPRSRCMYTDYHPVSITYHGSMQCHAFDGVIFLSSASTLALTVLMLLTKPAGRRALQQAWQASTGLKLIGLRAAHQSCTFKPAWLSACMTQGFSQQLSYQARPCN